VDSISGLQLHAVGGLELILPLVKDEPNAFSGQGAIASLQLVVAFNTTKLNHHEGT
jgi:hypothetical protein